MSATEDHSSLSLQLEKAINNRDAELHLSALRSALLRGFVFQTGKQLLECDAGTGVMSRYFSEQGLGVDCLVNSDLAAEVAIQRLQGQDGCRVVRSALRDHPALSTYDYIFASDMENLWRPSMITETAALAVEHLATDGVLMLAVGNRLGLKYLTGMPTSIGEPACSTIDCLTGSARLRDQSFWRQWLEQQGLLHSRWYFPFPDHLLPRMVCSAGLLERSEDCANLLYGMSSRDYLGEQLPPNHESMLWNAVIQNGQLGRFSNSFLILASRSAAALEQMIGPDFWRQADNSRRPCYRTLLTRSLNTNKVAKQPLYKVSSKQALITQKVGDEPWYFGTLLERFWLSALLGEDAWIHFQAQLRRYQGFLQNWQSTQDFLPYDLVPGNILVEDENHWHVFDQEWQTRENLEPDFLLFRALLLFIPRHAAYFAAMQKPLPYTTVGQLIGGLLDALGVDFAAHSSAWTAQEEQLQTCIRDHRENGVEQELKQLLAKDKFRCRLYWQLPGDTNFSPKQSLVQFASIGESMQTLVFALPAAATAVTALRLVPSSCPGFFRLFALRLYRYQGDSRTVVQQLQGGTELARALQLCHVRYADVPGQAYFLAETDNPQLIWPLDADPVTGSLDQLLVEVDIEWPRSPDYQYFRDQYVEQNLRLTEQLEQLECENNRLREKEAELAFMKTSKVWRLAEQGRDLLYNRLLGKIPRLRQLALAPAHGEMLEQLEGNASLGPVTERVLLKKHAEVYRRYLQNHQVTEDQRVQIREDIYSWQQPPLISIVIPVFNTPSRFLRAAVDSVVSQLYDHWELCLVDDASDHQETLDCLAALDDPRIKLRTLSSGRNISGATNAGIAMATGTYIAFLDHDDSLHETALYAMVREIQTGDWDLLYSDEDFIDEQGVRVRAHFKPDFSPQLLESHNYITHLVVVRRSLVEQAGLLRSDFDGAQDYDFLLRVTSLTHKIHHVSKVLYHWRMSDTSTAKSSEAKPETASHGRRALLDYLQQKNQSAEVRESTLPNFYQIRRHLDRQPKVSIVIPFKDRPDLLQRCIHSLLQRRTYTNLEVIGVSNNSELSSTFAVMEQLGEHPEIRFVEHNVPFNFSELVNFGAAEALGEVLMLMNNDIEIISWDWIERMLEHAIQADVGAVGGKLFYPDNSIQHAGLIVGIGGYAGHAFKGFRGNAPGYYNRLNITCNYAAVTGAFMMVERCKYEQIGGFDAKQFKVACNDVDFCLRLLEQGYYNVYTPFAQAYHWESLSRGYEDTAEKKTRFAAEKARFCERHREILDLGDPFYNPNLTLDEENFGLAE